jgi:VanZ family protein
MNDPLDFHLPCPDAPCFHAGVRGASSFLRYWLPVIIWMAIIFSASTAAMSSGNTSRFIGPVVRWLYPAISERDLARVVFTVRKTAHVTEYAVLALLFWRAWRKPLRNDTRPWRWSEALLALLVTAFYAASDEIHQYFVPSREARFGDVMLDTAGAAAGLLAMWIVGLLRRRW